MVGLFTKKKITEEKVKKLNSLLPIEMQKEEWFESQFNNDFEGIHKSLSRQIKKTIQTPCEELEKRLNKLLESKRDELIKYLKIFNSEPYDCIPLGMVDIGATHKFGAKSSGDRFANGLIGYAIENAADNLYSEGNIQEQVVNSVKLELIKKAKLLFPKCNLIFKYEVDFRELGSSGNVFIYMRGTACNGQNPELKEAEKKYLKSDKNILLKQTETELENKRNELLEAKSNLSKIPKSISELNEF